MFKSYDLTSKNTKIDYNFIYLLASEPSAAKVTKSYSRRLPALETETGADTGGWRGDIRHPLTDSGRGVAPP